MDIRNFLKLLLSSSGMTFNELIARYSEQFHRVTRQNISMKLSRGTITYEEMTRFAEILGYEIKWEKKK